jgi:hypothetical protein
LMEIRNLLMITRTMKGDKLEEIASHELWRYLDYASNSRSRLAGRCCGPEGEQELSNVYGALPQNYCVCSEER